MDLTDNPKEINALKTGIVYLGLLVQGIRADELKKLYEDVGAMSWFIDPTWDRDNAEHMQIFKEMLDHLSKFKEAAKIWIEKNGKKGGLMMSTDKTDEFRIWLMMEFLSFAPAEMREFLGE